MYIRTSTSLDVLNPGQTKIFQQRQKNKICCYNRGYWYTSFETLVLSGDNWQTPRRSSELDSRHLHRRSCGKDSVSVTEWLLSLRNINSLENQKSHANFVTKEDPGTLWLGLSILDEYSFDCFQFHWTDFWVWSLALLGTTFWSGKREVPSLWEAVGEMTWPPSAHNDPSPLSLT